MKIDENNKLVMFFVSRIKHYNHEKYWKMRNEVINPKSKVPRWLRLFYLFRIKRMDAFANASMGTGFGYGASFSTPPNLVHYLNGIIISHYAKFGKNCTIFQQVTVAEENGKAATIGDNVFIGAGAKIIGEVTIGNNVKIGANAVVVHDVPDDCTVVGVPGRII